MASFDAAVQKFSSSMIITLLNYSLTYTFKTVSLSFIVCQTSSLIQYKMSLEEVAC